MTLYSLRTSPIGFTITKFTADLEPEATYNLTPQGFSYTCDCPANNRSVVTKPCRHKLMMSNLLPIVDTGKFYCFESGEIIGSMTEEELIEGLKGAGLHVFDEPLVGEAVHAEAALVGEALGSPAEPPRATQAPTIRRR